jgi:hypothetical protein
VVLDFGQRGPSLVELCLAESAIGVAGRRWHGVAVARHADMLRIKG